MIRPKTRERFFHQMIAVVLTVLAAGCAYATTSAGKPTTSTTTKKTNQLPGTTSKAPARKRPAPAPPRKRPVTAAPRVQASLVGDLDFSSATISGPRTATAAAIVVDALSGDVLFAKDADAQRPIASLSKLVTAMVVLDAGLSFGDIQSITKEDAWQSSRSRLRPGLKMTIGDLLQTSLMISDNRATRALARAVAGTLDSFAVLMNAKVQSLGLDRTHFEEPTGLNPQNVSTAEEVARIITYAAKYPTISRITSTRTAMVRATYGKRSGFLTLSNTNELLTSPLRVLAGKTGYISQASYCLATIVQNEAGETLTLVVLGASGDKARFREARKLATWAFTRV